MEASGSHMSYKGHVGNWGFKEECVHEQKPEDSSSFKMLAQIGTVPLPS